MQKWIIEDQSDGESEAFRILEIADDKAILRYVAMDEEAATNLVTALNWLDTFRAGAIPADPRPRTKRKPEQLIIQLEMEPQKPRRKPKA